ncbi:hypothetical protein [Methylovirgula sp. 4M-Z18]|uniref:hypothetical protein n=1 Tax=Methylovirgula sp. 4M-Z18 TaxID=2293567 RepID=UPI000E2F9CD0|nr:hypothetical protein [Methylovirgula sp. 4M-Z18]RFB75631.1 hypothetical protein DYH55_21530 [Methylovirgula sp. 4M-Z18]
MLGISECINGALVGGGEAIFVASHRLASLQRTAGRGNVRRGVGPGAGRTPPASMMMAITRGSEPWSA